MLERRPRLPGAGIVLEDARPGYARTALTIGPAMVNGHAIAHVG